tara:strand:- start:4695 stop:4937 length:243 start_codon:yes stop_codon:yes gene_type:complete
MDDQNPEQGNSRTPYKMVALITVWVDDDQDHEEMIYAASKIVNKELIDAIDGSKFSVGNRSTGFETNVESVEIIRRVDFH